MGARITFVGSGVLWDAAMNKVLCEFKEGRYSTDDEREIGILTSAGYARLETPVHVSKAIAPVAEEVVPILPVEAPAAMPKKKVSK